MKKFLELFQNRKPIFVYISIVITSIIVIGILYFIYISTQLSVSGKPLWNEETASYLAHRVLLDPTNEDIQTLFHAGSAKAAVNILLASPSNTDNYNSGLQNLEQASSSKTYKFSANFQRTVYTYKLIHDPDNARRKLYYLWENIFSVDQQVDPGDAADKIDYQDMQNLDNILYDGAYGNYITMLKQVQGSFAMGKYLNLIDSNPKNPNENYSREVMQLFLMGQYTPLDTGHKNTNYSDADVNSLAYLLTGYRADVQTHVVTFDEKNHYMGQKMFLGNNVNFTDPTQVIDYIVKNRNQQISEFLAEKILKYYVSDNPQPKDIVTFANIISQNNFDIKPSLQWLFTSSLFYQNNYMNEDRYRSPMELVSSFYTSIFGRNAYNIIPDQQILSSLAFIPYHPGSVFGRPGFNTNVQYFSGGILDAWISGIDRLLRSPQYTSGIKQFLSSTITQNDVKTPQELIQALELKIYNGTRLPSIVEQDLVNYISTKDINSSLNVSNATSYQKMLGLLDIMFTQPEFMMDSGNYSAVPFPNPHESSTATSKLIIIRLRGGLDYQELVANASDPDYTIYRKSLALGTASSTKLGNGYVLNNAANSLMPLIASHQVSFVTSVGLPGQVRAHDIASTQMETGLLPDNQGIGSALKVDMPSLSLISLTNSSPIFYNGTQSLQMGATNLTLFPELKVDNKNPQGQLATLQKVLMNRLLPSELSLYYAQTFLLNEIGNKNIASGGKGTPGAINSTQFPFLQYLINQNIGDIYYLYADDTYDFHAQEEPKFDSQIKNLMSNIVNLFNVETSKGQKLTIVLFSEFGRTDKTNGNDGTDHGIGGGMITISNKLKWPTMIGALHPSTDTNNWTNVQVDERDVWDTIFNSLYNIPTQKLFNRSETIQSYPITIN